MQFPRRQYLDLMTFGPAPRPMFVELFGPLIGLEAEWRAQGAADDEISLVAFDWDFVPVIGCGGSCGPRGGAPEVILHEDATSLLKRDRFGRTLKLDKRTATIPLPMDFPVKTMDDWLRFKPMFEFTEDRLDPAAIAKAKAAQATADGGALVVAGIPGAFDTARELMGEEVACLAYYDQPELMHDILSTLARTSLAVLERVSAQVTIDQLSVHEDMAGKSGPLAGPVQVREFFRPYFRPVWDLLSSRGTRIFQMDTDGNVNAIIPDLLDCGLTCIFPMEPAAGMDMVALRRQYGPRLAMAGGIDKFALQKSHAEIRAELEHKLQPLMRAGGTVFGLDHRIPNGTPLDNYRYYVDTGREILGLPPRDAGRKGWRRMAF